MGGGSCWKQDFLETDEGQSAEGEMGAPPNLAMESRRPMRQGWGTRICPPGVSKLSR